MRLVNLPGLLRTVTVAVIALFLAGTALAQQPPRHGERRMSQEDRARLREDLGSARRDTYKAQRELPREQRAGDGRRLSPDEHHRLRRDLEDANRGESKRR